MTIAITPTFTDFIFTSLLALSLRNPNIFLCTTPNRAGDAPVVGRA
jgi:hypothetical protein